MSYRAARREDFGRTTDWLDAVCGVASYVKTCPWGCGRVVGPYTNAGDLNQAMTTHVNWIHRTGEVVANERDYTSYRTRSPRARQKI